MESGEKVTLSIDELEDAITAALGNFQEVTGPRASAFKAHGAAAGIGICTPWFCTPCTAGIRICTRLCIPGGPKVKIERC